MSEASDDEQRPLLTGEDGDQPQEATSDAATATEASCRHRCKGCFLVEPILVLFALGIFPLFIISQKYTLDWYENDGVHVLIPGQNDSHPNTSASLCHTNASHDEGDQRQEYAQSRASMFSLYSSLLMGVPAVFVTVVLGAGSDRFGRRFAVIPPVFGVFASSLISTAVILTNSHVYWLFLANFVSGCTGSFLSILMACFAYVVDRTPPERRLFRILIVEMSLLISGIISPIINGAVVTKFGYLYPLLFVVAASVLNLIYVVFFFPKNTRQDDSLHALSNSTHCQARLASFLPVIWQQVRSMFRIFFKNPPVAVKAASRWRRLKLNLLMVAFFITNLPAFSLSVSTLFEMNHPLCWDVSMVGLFTGLSSAVSGVGAVIVTPVFKLCHTPDIVIAIISSLASLATNVYMVFVRTTVMMFLTLCVSMLRILFVPSLRTLLSKEVGEEQQGSLFGAISCLEVICMTVGTAMFSSIYSATLSISTAFVFLVMAAFYLVGCILVGTYAILTKVSKRNSSDVRSKTLGDVLQ